MGHNFLKVIWIYAFELWSWRRLLSVPWTARRSNQSTLKETNPEYSLKGLMLKLKLQYLWPPDAKSWLIGKAPDAGKNWGQEERRVTEDEMVGWHHWLNGHESEKTSGDSEGQGSLVCCNPWVCQESDMTEWLDNKTNNESRGPSVAEHWWCSLSSTLGLSTYVGSWEWNVPTSWGGSINPMGPVFP